MCYWFCVTSCGQLIPLRRAGESRAARWLGETPKRSGSTCPQRCYDSAGVIIICWGELNAKWLCQVLVKQNWKVEIVSVNMKRLSESNSSIWNRKSANLQQMFANRWGQQVISVTQPAGQLQDTSIRIYNAQVGLCTTSSPWTLRVRRETKHQSGMPEVKFRRAT